MPRRIRLQKTTLVKSAVYTAVCLILLLFSDSFLPALRLTRVTPNLLIAAVSLLAYFEGAGYASLFAVCFGALHAGVCGFGSAVLPFFYTLFALVCAWLYERFFAKNFFAWLCYTMAGLFFYGLIGLFYAVSAWKMPLGAPLLIDALYEFCLSLVLSLPLYKLFGFLSRKTERRPD